MTTYTTEGILEQHMEYYGEYLEMMHPEERWKFLAHMLASKLAEQKELTAFYKGMAYARK